MKAIKILQVLLSIALLFAFLNAQQQIEKTNPVQKYFEMSTNFLIEKHLILCKSALTSQCTKQQMVQTGVQTCQKTKQSFQTTMKQIQNKIMSISKSDFQIQMDKGLQLFLDSILQIKGMIVKGQCMKQIDKDYDVLVQEWNTLKKTALLVRQKKQQMDQQQKANDLIQQL